MLRVLSVLSTSVTPHRGRAESTPPPPAGRGAAGCRPAPWHSLRGQRLAGLEQRLEAAQHHHPAGAGDALGRLRRGLEAVVNDGQLAIAAVLGLDLPAHAARLLSRE